MAFVFPTTTRLHITSHRKGMTCLRSRNKHTFMTGPNRLSVKMGLGEDGLQEDLEFAKGCIEGGCEIDAVQDVLTRLERRRAVLALEVSQIEDIMAVLAKENLGGDRSLVAEAMAAAVSIFAKTNDDYPGVGSETNAWTLDPLKKQPKY